MAPQSEQDFGIAAKPGLNLNSILPILKSYKSCSDNNAALHRPPPSKIHPVPYLPLPLGVAAAEACGVVVQPGDAGGELVLLPGAHLCA
jgi:hypothetical protein